MTSRGGWGRLALKRLGLVLALWAVVPSANAASPAPRARTIYHKSRSFRIPFNVDPADRPRLKEVQLWVSEDAGFTWKPNSIATPNRPSFTFRAPKDAEYWFAVRTLDTQGKLYPGEEDLVEPRLKVVIDTKPPSLLLEPEGRRGSLASIRWEVRDEHLDLASFVLEYRTEGAREWRQVPIQRPALLGSERWDAGTAEEIRVRASVADRAGNTVEHEVTLGEGVPSKPSAGSDFASDYSNAPPPISQISTPNYPPADEGFPPSDTPSEPVASQERPADRNSPDADAFGPEPAAPRGQAGTAGGSRTLLVATPQFPMQYAVDDAGPNGPKTVELWVTQDGGRTWIRRSEDPDKASPFPVDLGGEGTFGLSLVARSASGLGDQAPAPGDSPQVWVEVDSTPPSVQLLRVQPGTGRYMGKVAIMWRATDLHLGNRPIVISWRTEEPGARWLPIAEPLENTGKYIWTVPLNAPPRFHLKVEATDTLGNVASAETTESEPVIVDRTRPRSRIIGLDPSARSGGNPSARPLR